MLRAGRLGSESLPAALPVLSSLLGKCGGENLVNRDVLRFGDLRDALEQVGVNGDKVTAALEVDVEMGFGHVGPAVAHVVGVEEVHERVE